MNRIPGFFYLAAFAAVIAAGDTGFAQTAPPAPSADAQPAGASTGRGVAQNGQQVPRLTSFPTRPKAPQEVLNRGKATFGVSCAFCHGSDAGGGEVGPNLKRSGVVLEDQNGELIEPIVHGGRQAQGMPRIELTNDQISDIAAWLHSLAVTSRTDPNAEKINILVGKAEPGQVAFQHTCASCHSVTGDLQAFGTKFNDPKALQQWWLIPGSGSRGGAVKPPPGLHLQPMTAVATMKDGTRVQGDVVRLDDYTVRLKLQDGTERTIDRAGVKLEVHDPLDAHKQLLKTISDKDIHDITAYLVTLK